MGLSNLATPVVSAFINVFSKGNLYLERGIDVYIDLDYMAIKIKSEKNSKKMDQYITNNNRPTNLFCTANIVENLFIVTNNNNITRLRL